MTPKRATSIDEWDRILVAGTVLIALAAYVALSPGRIDIVDGQWRFDVAYNLLRDGSMAVTDPALSGWGLEGVDGGRYSVYGLSGSLVALPLVFIAELLDYGNRDLAQFCFSLTSPVLSAVTLGLVYLVFRHLGVSALHAVRWTGTLGFGSLYLPLATSVFDQNQNALFVLVAFYGAYMARRQQSSAPAIIGSLAFAVLINFKEAYLVLWPGLLWTAGLPQFQSLTHQLRVNRTFFLYIAGGLLGLAVWATANWVRYGQGFPPPSPGYHPPILGNPVVGLMVLTISPGKGLLWYSPVVLLVFTGWAGFWRAHPVLAQGILVGSVSWTLLIASLSFSGGDWCWGPRYWIPIFPLLFLAVAFQTLSGVRAALAVGLIVISVSIQCVAVAVDHQRFFLERGLAPFFWYEDEFYYFKHSALLARLSELKVLRSPLKEKVDGPFRPGPHSELLTYSIFGPNGKERARRMSSMQSYPVFFLPRPWPLWSLAVSDSRIQRSRGLAVAVVASLGCGGGLMLVIGLRRRLVPIDTYGA